MALAAPVACCGCSVLGEDDEEEVGLLQTQGRVRLGTSCSPMKGYFAIAFLGPHGVTSRCLVSVLVLVPELPPTLLVKIADGRAF